MERPTTSLTSNGIRSISGMLSACNLGALVNSTEASPLINFPCNMRGFKIKMHLKHIELGLKFHFIPIFIFIGELKIDHIFNSFFI